MVFRYCSFAVDCSFCRPATTIFALMSSLMMYYTPCGDRSGSHLIVLWESPVWCKRNYIILYIFHRFAKFSVT